MSELELKKDYFMKLYSQRKYEWIEFRKIG